MVIDQYQDRFDWFKPDPAARPTGALPAVTFWPQAQIDELKALIAEFKEALAAAKLVDKVTGQPDCEDPEKAKLVDRVEELEKRVLGTKRYYLKFRGGGYVPVGAPLTVSTPHRDHTAYSTVDRDDAFKHRHALEAAWQLIPGEIKVVSVREK